VNDPGGFAFGFIAEGIKRLRARRKRKRMQSWAEEHDGPPDEILEEFNSQPDEVSMDALKGAVKSKLMWLGLAQVLYGLVQLWANGMLTVESAGPVLGGVLTMWFRAVTTDSLADKAK
jgi:hypothetical protein